MTSLGHLVLYVSDMEPMLRFYRDVVGLHEVGRVHGGRVVALTGGRTHHELLLIEVGPAPGPLQGRRLGLYHTGWCIGDDDDDLREALLRAQNMEVRLVGTADHTVSHSLYLLDPDGNEVELYVDVPGIDWKDPSWLDEPIRGLRL
jgi:catechol 2,3-dioxygenase